MRFANSSRSTGYFARWYELSLLMAEVAILGAGAWGTALAVLLTNNGHRTVLCVRRHEQLEAMTARRENAVHLPGVALPAKLELAEDWATAVGDATTVVMAVPSQYARATIAPIIGAIAASSVIVSVTKGIEQSSLCYDDADDRGTGAAGRARRGAVGSGICGRSRSRQTRGDSRSGESR